MSFNGPNVYLVGGDQWGEQALFLQHGWNVVLDHNKADFVCFTGGADISPKFYGEETHRTTSVNHRRDAYEYSQYEMLKGKPMLGICRGGQLLNAFSGGKMYQHVDGHHRTHSTIDLFTGEVLSFSSVHHQMMIPGPGADILAIAPGQSSFRETFDNREEGRHDDIEAIFYPATKAFCFQPHPEWGPSDCTKYFFRTIDRLYG